MVLRMATRILDIIGMAISPLLEAAFDEMECRFARRVVIGAARSQAGGGALEQTAAHQLGQIEPERRA
jgi:hypothetical protein